MTRVSRRKSRPAHSSSDITYRLRSPPSQGRILSSFTQTFQSPGSSFMTFCTRVLHGTLGKEVEYCIAQRRKQERGRSGVGGGCEGVMAAVAELSLPCTADRSLEQRCSPSVSQEVLFGILRSLHTLAGRLNLREDVVKITIDWNELQSLSASSLLCSLGHSSNTFYIYSLF